MLFPGENRIQAYSTKNRPVFGLGSSFGEPQVQSHGPGLEESYSRAQKLARRKLACFITVRPVCRDNVLIRERLHAELLTQFFRDGRQNA